MKQFRRVVYIVVIVGLVTAIQVAINYYFTDEEKMLQAFSGTKSKVIQSEVKVVGKYGTKFLSEQDCKNLITFIAGKTGLSKEMEYQELKGNKATCLTAKKEAVAGDTLIEVIRVEREEESVRLYDIYINASLTLYKDTDSILTFKSRLEEAMNELDMESYDTAVSLQGVYDGELLLEEKDQISDQLLEDLQGDIVSQNREDGLYIIYAYSPLIGSYMNSGGKRINIQVSFTYDEVNQRTTLYVASPILNSDY